MDRIDPAKPISTKLISVKLFQNSQDVEKCSTYAHNVGKSMNDLTRKILTISNDYTFKKYTKMLLTPDLQICKFVFGRLLLCR